MIVPIVITTVEVTDADTTLLVLKIPTNSTGEHLTSVQPVKIRNRTVQADWLDGMQEALSRAFSEISGAWGEPKASREKLLTELATTLAAREITR